MAPGGLAHLWRHNPDRIHHLRTNRKANRAKLSILQHTKPDQPYLFISLRGMDRSIFLLESISICLYWLGHGPKSLGNTTNVRSRGPITTFNRHIRDCADNQKDPIAANLDGTDFHCVGHPCILLSNSSSSVYFLSVCLQSSRRRWQHHIPQRAGNQTSSNQTGNNCRRLTLLPYNLWIHSQHSRFRSWRQHMERKYLCPPRPPRTLICSKAIRQAKSLPVGRLQLPRMAWDNCSNA